MDKPKLRRFIPLVKCTYNKIFWDPLELNSNPERHTLIIGPDDPEPPKHFKEVTKKPVAEKVSDIQPVSMKEVTDEMFGKQVEMNNKILDSMPEPKAKLKRLPSRRKVKRR